MRKDNGTLGASGVFPQLNMDSDDKGTNARRYDTNKKAYRYVRMSSNGQIEENVGQWNDRTRSFEWKVVNGEPGITRTSTNRIIGNDVVQAHIIAERSGGKVHMDLTIRSTRRK